MPVDLTFLDGPNGPGPDRNLTGGLLLDDYVIVVYRDPEPNAVRTSAKPPLAIPGVARIQHATFQITVDPPGRSLIGDVAEVRETPPSPLADSSFTIDFAGLRTVSAMTLPVLSEFYYLSQWMGTGFSDYPFYLADSSADEITSNPSIEFPEVMTERILVDIRNPVTVDDVLAGTVTIPTPPQSVEVLVNGTRAWFSPIDATSPTTLPGGGAAHSLAAEIDLVAAMQEALDRDGTVEVELKTSGPCVMSIASPDLSFLRIHPVTFPDGPNRTIDAAVEGTYVLDLPLDGTPGADDWEVRAVELRATGELGPVRVRPPVGPTLVDDIDLVLTGERTLLVKLASTLLADYRELTGLRLPLRAGSGGGELAAALVADDAATGRPGPPIEGVEFAPLTVAEGAQTSYLTVDLAEPWSPEPDVDVWVSLRASRGELTWALAEPEAGAEPTDTEIRWRAPSGSARLLPAIGRDDDGADGAAETAEAAFTGAVRVVGVADPNRPIAALEVAVEDRPQTAAITPVPSGTDIVIELTAIDQITPTDQGVSGVVRLALTVAAPGTYLFDSAVVVYRDPALDGGGS